MTDAPDLCPGCFLEARAAGPCRRCAYEHDPGAFPTALRPGTRLSKYTLGRVLGKPGGFGITYLAFDPVLHRRVAIKELMPRELVARRPDGATVQVHTRDDGETFKYTLVSFLNEARLLAQFSHPNVVRVLDYFEGNGTAYFAMEYYEGQTLAEHVHRSGGRIPGANAVALLLPVLDALDHIHSLTEPILHRDIKPANIYLTGRQTPILLDFGAARVAMGQQSRSLSAVLTPGYAPYEQYSTRGKQGPWSDVYACAATLHYLVTGRVPPEASDRIESPQLESPRTFAPSLAPELNDAIVYGLGFRPEERPQSARAFADVITGRASAPLAATKRVPGSAPIGDSGSTEIPRTVVDSQTQLRTVMANDRTVMATEIAPATTSHVAPPVGRVDPPPMPPPPTPPPPPSPPLQVRRASNRMPLFAAVAALVLVVATAWGAGLFEGKTENNDPPRREEPENKQPPPVDPVEPPVPTPRTVDPPKSDPPVITPLPDTAKATNPGSSGTSTTPAANSSARGDTPSAPAQNTPVVPAPPPAGVLVVMRGDDPDEVRQAEGTILRALAGRSGLQALDADSLSMMRGDQSAVQAATSGNFSALAALGRQHGVELMVVGELRSRATPSINRFFTGTAEASVRMYRVSTSQIVDTQTFTVGQGGSQPVLAVSEGEARSRAAAQAASAAADGVGSWLGRAF